LAVNDNGSGIVLYHAHHGQPERLTGTLPSEQPVEFVNSGRSLLVADVVDDGSNVTVIDLASGHRQLWKHLPSRIFSSSRILAVTPDLKYYAHGVPHYSTDLYLVENLR
jgi:hypothetical protein